MGGSLKYYVKWNKSSRKEKQYDFCSCEIENKKEQTKKPLQRTEWWLQRTEWWLRKVGAWGECEVGKGSQIYYNGGKLDLGWGAHNAVHRCQL